MPRKRKRKINWAKYEQLRKLPDKKVFTALKNAVHALPEAYTIHNGGRGRPDYNPKAVTVLILWQFYVNKSDRDYQNYIKSTNWIKEELNLSQIPDRRTLNRYRKKITPEYLSRLNQLILKEIEPSKKLIVDSTGLKTSRKLAAWSVKKGDGGF